jgi:MaoC dehydratase-like protein
VTSLPTDWSKPFAVPVDADKVREIARAAGSASPHYDEAAPVAPPAFFYGAAYLWGYTWESPGDSPLRDAPVDPTALLHAEEEVEFPSGEPPRAGVELSARVRLESVEDKTSRSSGRTLRFVRATTEFRDPAGELVALARTTVVEEREE